MFGRTKVELPIEVASLDADLAAVEETLAADRERLGEIDEQIKASVNVDEREQFREERQRVEARIDDAQTLRSTLSGRRDRLAMEAELAKLDPFREKIAAGEREILDLRAQLGLVEATVAAAKVTLEDASSAIRNPNPSLSSESRWIIGQLRHGGSPAADAAFSRLSRREQLLIGEHVAALNAQLPTERELVRRRAARSWEEAEITPQGFAEGGEIGTVPMPNPPLSRESLNPKVG